MQRPSNESTVSRASTLAFFLPIAILVLALSSTIAAAASDDSPQKPAVKDEATGFTFAVQADDHTLVASDAKGKTVWKVDVIASAGAPPRGSTAIRQLLLKDARLHVIYGKHSFAVYSPKDGKLLGSGSD